MSDAAPSTIPQKRPAQPDDSQQPQPRSRIKEKTGAREPREKKESWRKKDSTLSGSAAGSTVSGGAGPASGKHTENTTPKAADTPGLVRYRLPPPQFQDFYGHRAPPVAPVEMDTNTPGEFFAVNDQYVCCHWAARAGEGR